VKQGRRPIIRELRKVCIGLIPVVDRLGASGGLEVRPNFSSMSSLPPTLSTSDIQRIQSEKRMNSLSLGDEVSTCRSGPHLMVRRKPACVVDDHLGGSIDATTTGCVGDMCVGVVPGRYNQVPRLNLMNPLTLSGYTRI